MHIKTFFLRKLLKIKRSDAWAKILNLTINAGGAQGFGSKRGELLIKIRECFVRVNIYYQSKSLL
jgi:hypothetical protein